MRAVPGSTTYRMPGTVIEVSATLVATTTRGTEAGTTTTTFENTTEVVPDQSDVTLSTSKFESRPVNVALYFILRFTSEPSRGLAGRP